MNPLSHSLFPPATFAFLSVKPRARPPRETQWVKYRACNSLKEYLVYSSQQSAEKLIFIRDKLMRSFLLCRKGNCLKYERIRLMKSWHSALHSGTDWADSHIRIFRPRWFRCWFRASAFTGTSFFYVLTRKTGSRLTLSPTFGQTNEVLVLVWSFSTGTRVTSFSQCIRLQFPRIAGTTMANYIDSSGFTCHRNVPGPRTHVASILWKSVVFTLVDQSEKASLPLLFCFVF